MLKSRYLYVLLSFGFMVQNINAQSLKELIASSLESKPSLQVIKERILSSKASVALSTQFDNPELSFKINDISFSDPLNRSLEAMQWSSVNFKQKLPYFGKRSAREKVALAQEALQVSTLSQAQNELVYSIKRYAYKIWELEEHLKIIDSYVDLTKHDIELSESYTATSENRHMGIMAAELSLSKLRIQKFRLQGKVKAYYTRLSYLTATQVSKLKLTLKMPMAPNRSLYDTRLSSNIDVLVKHKNISKKEAILKRTNLDHYPDTNVQVGYAYRTSFNDFLSIGIGMKLPIYGSEDDKDEIAKRELLMSKSDLADTQNKVKSQFDEAFIFLRSAYEIYSVLVDESIPQVEHMSDVEVSSVAAGEDLFEYIDILFKKFSLEQEEISAIANYYQAQASLEKLIGMIQ